MDDVQYFLKRYCICSTGNITEKINVILHWYVTCSSPRRAVRPHSLVCSKNYLSIVGIGPICDKEL